MRALLNSDFLSFRISIRIRRGSSVEWLKLTQSGLTSPPRGVGGQNSGKVHVSFSVLDSDRIYMYTYTYVYIIDAHAHEYWYSFVAPRAT